ncbi:MAG TPA: hypothetical protein DD414_10725 [Lachnospiraceae bacterium]|nr:hypothetical protein [Lachnospiraceae bacterium]
MESVFRFLSIFDKMQVQKSCNITKKQKNREKACNFYAKVLYLCCIEIAQYNANKCGICFLYCIKCAMKSEP